MGIAFSEHSSKRKPEAKKRVIELFLKNPERKKASIAREVGVSTRTAIDWIYAYLDEIELNGYCVKCFKRECECTLDMETTL